MKKTTITLLTLAIVSILGVTVYFLTGYFSPKEAGILADSTPSSDVYINGNLAGKTPYSATLKPQEIVIKLVPQANSSLAPYETKVSLTNGVKTIVKREFGNSEEESSGEIISFEKEAGKVSSLAIVTIPDAAQISIDGQVRAFSPYKTSGVAVGEHLIKLSVPSYSQKELVVRTYEGFKLTILAKLAASPQPSPSPSPDQKPTETTTYVEIQQTPTGFLRIRSQPNTGGVEIGQVEPGERFPLLEESTSTGWFKIEFEKEASGPEGHPARWGWISSQYAKKTSEVKE